MPRPVQFVAFGLIVLSAGAEAASSKPQLLNVQELITSDDYPSIATRNGQEGAVNVQVQVDRDGLVTWCKVKSSSGHSALDEQTCALFRARARFAPARDRRGRPVESTYEKRVVWRLEGEAEPPLPRQAWLIRNIVSFNNAGEPVGCEAEVVGLPPTQEPCLHFLRAAGAAASDGGGNVTGHFLTETYFFPVETAKATIPPYRKDSTMIGQQISEIVIDPDGRVSQCQAMRYSGAANEAGDLCEALERTRFLPAIAGAGPMKATMVTTAYLRKRIVT